MKSYTCSEVAQIINELDQKHATTQEEIFRLRENRKAAKLFDFKEKTIIDQKLEELIIQLTCYSYSIMMFHLYEDSLHFDKSSMDDEKFIQYEKEAESGDGISKLIVFCHKCFIDHTIIDRDIKRLELEAKAGDRSSLYILFGYNTFFAD